MIKRWFKHSNYAVPISYLLYCYLWLVRITSRVTIEGDEYLNTARQERLIIATWHENIPCFLWAWPFNANFPLSALASDHRDGRLVAYTMQRFGHFIQPYDKHAPHKSLIAAAKHLKSYQRMALSVAIDGPRGPRHEAKGGAFIIAKRADAKLIPLASWTKRAIQLKSWDQIRFPLPFNHIYIKWGEPIPIENQETIQSACEALETNLNQLHAGFY